MYQETSLVNTYSNFPSITAMHHILTYLHLVLEAFKGKEGLGRKKEKKKQVEKFKENHRN